MMAITSTTTRTAKIASDEIGSNITAPPANRGCYDTAGTIIKGYGDMAMASGGGFRGGAIGRPWSAAASEPPGRSPAVVRCTAQQIRIDPCGQAQVWSCGAYIASYPICFRDIPAVDVAPSAASRSRNSRLPATGSQMQLFNPPPEREVGCHGGPGQV